MEANGVLSFWFQELTPKDWFRKDEALDVKIRERFELVHRAATLGELENWRSSSLGRLAEIIVLDQFSRNIYRDDPRAFAFDGMALVLAQEAVRLGCDKELSKPQKPFLFMPYMHSESPAIHATALRLFSEPGLDDNLKFEVLHKEIIDRFGRFPHRNRILGRVSTADEIEFLKTHSGF